MKLMPEEQKIKKLTEIHHEYVARKLKEKEAKKKVNKSYYVKRNPKVPKEECESWQKKNPLRFKKFQILKDWNDRGLIDENIDELYFFYQHQRRCLICNTWFSNGHPNRVRDLFINKDGEPGLVLCKGCLSEQPNDQPI
tara:strand:- start:855 stop:1271 length:417 start_codon:yes stop_codon:yes gene_type:complete